MPPTNEARRDGVRDGLGARGCISHTVTIVPKIQRSPSVRQAQKRNPLRQREAEWSGGLQRGEGAALPPQWGVCRTWSPRFLACLSPAPLSPGQRPAKRGGRNLRWDTQRTQGTTSVGFMEPCIKGMARADRQGSSCGRLTAHGSIEPTGCTSVAREFTGTDRPRVNPECRTHGPRVWVGSDEQGSPLGVDAVSSRYGPCQPTAGVLPCSFEPTPKPRQARNERGSREGMGTGGAPAVHPTFSGGKHGAVFSVEWPTNTRSGVSQTRELQTRGAERVPILSFELLSVSVGFPSRPGGQGHFPGCIPSS
jgi:hypothetical protein